MVKYCGFGGKRASNLKRPSKPLFEAKFEERYTPDWDIVSGMGQRNEQVIARYKRGSNFHPHAVRPGESRK